MPLRTELDQPATAGAASSLRAEQHVPISLAAVLIAFAYLEEDGVLLTLAVALGLFAAGTAALWGAIATAAWLSR